MFECTSPSSNVSILFGVDIVQGPKPQYIFTASLWLGNEAYTTASIHESGPPAGTYHRDLRSNHISIIRIHNLQENIRTIVPKLPCSFRLSAAIKGSGEPSPSRETIATLAEGNDHNQDRQHLFTTTTQSQCQIHSIPTQALSSSAAMKPS